MVGAVSGSSTTARSVWGSAGNVDRTATGSASNDARGGLVHIFLPPTDALEHFIDLVARVEAAATTANCPVVIEGYG
ncbi:transglutaminase family protein, partial [Mycobacterium tuberculosis]|uniref:transglutaminase family protein n=1 Tax=Mycobacterium tuberculosis TaxID=1773 RepID=UPI003C6E98BF